jgi:hypothetical protein
VTRYDIDASGVSTVVSKVGGHIAGDNGQGRGALSEQLENFGTHVGEAATAAASTPIGTALQEFLAYVNPELAGMVERTVACIDGAVTATEAYIDGDLQMVETAQRNAVSAPAPSIGSQTSGDPHWRYGAE